MDACIPSDPHLWLPGVSGVVVERWLDWHRTRMVGWMLGQGFHKPKVVWKGLEPRELVPEVIIQVDEDVVVAEICWWDYILWKLEDWIRTVTIRDVKRRYFQYFLWNVFFRLDVQVQFQSFQVHISRIFWDGITKQLVTIWNGSVVR